MLSPEAMNEIFENIKDMGVLIGKGGVYGQVAALTHTYEWLQYYKPQPPHLNTAVLGSDSTFYSLFVHTKDFPH